MYGHSPTTRRVQRTILFLILAGLSLGILLTPLSEDLQQSWPGRVIAFVFYPFIAATQIVSDGAYGLYIAAFHREELFEEKNQLVKKNLELTIENQRLRQANDYLAQLTRTQRNYADYKFDLLQAKIVAYSSRYYSQSCVLDRGFQDGVRPDMIVVGLEGVAGVVRRVSGGLAAVQLISDTRARIGGRIEGEGLVGIVRGIGDPDTLTFDPGGKIMEMKVGDRVETAGTEGSLYPEGLTIGFITAIELDKTGSMIAQIRPATHSLTATELYIVLNSGTVTIDEKEMH